MTTDTNDNATPSDDLHVVEDTAEVARVLGTPECMKALADAAKAGRQGYSRSGDTGVTSVGRWIGLAKTDDDATSFLAELNAKDATIRELREKVRVLEQLSRDLHFAYTNKDGDAPHGFEEQALADYARLIATDANATIAGVRKEIALCQVTK